MGRHSRGLDTPLRGYSTA